MAIDVLAAGGIVALPTDTVYGIAVALSTTGGIERLFAANGDWRSVTVSPGSGTASSLAMLNAIFLEHALRRTPLRPLRGPVVATLNRVARWLDGRSATLRGTRPGTLAANYHVVAERAS